MWARIEVALSSSRVLLCEGTPVFPHSLWHRCLLAAALLLPAGASRVAAHDAYFLLMFASQQTPPYPNHSHTFATFVRVRYDGAQPCHPVMEAYTISWLPANLKIRDAALLPEPGHNFGLLESLQVAAEDHQRTSLWGPYQIDPDLYNRALQQIQLLQSGQVRYKAVDTGWSTDRVSNCIHAVSSIAEGHRLRVLSPGWGETASFAVLRRFQPWIIDQDRKHPWVASALQLDGYPIIYRDFEQPRSARFRNSLSQLLGRGRDATPSYGPPAR